MPIDWQRNQQLFRRLSRLLGKVARHPQPEAVHHFRTTARRLEAVFDALEPSPDKAHRKLLKQVTKLRRRCGRLRDVDVQLDALRTLKQGRETTHKQRLLRHLERLRTKREEKLQAALTDKSIHKLRARLRKIATSLSSPRAAAAARPLPQLDPLPEALRLFATMVRGHGPLTEDTLHQYRIHGKRVRYLAEMAGNHPRVKEVVKQLKRMQDAIGVWHDWWDLTRTAEDLFADRANLPLVLALDNITRAKFQEAVRISTEVKRTLLALHRALVTERRKPVPVPVPAPNPDPLPEAATA